MFPESFAIINDGRPVGASDRARYDLERADGAGHGAILSRTGSNRAPNPAWPDEVSTVRAYLGGPCALFAPVGSNCPYSTIDRGF